MAWEQSEELQLVKPWGLELAEPFDLALVHLRVQVSRHVP
jgi:hypothetical protein